ICASTILTSSFFFFSSRRRHTRSKRDWSSDVCSSDLALKAQAVAARNYALRCMSTRSSNAYHMVDTASDQVFRGYEGSSSIIQRSEERRVGKESRYRGGAEQ